MQAPFADFWEWWRTASPRIAAAIEAGTVHGVVEEIGTQVQAVDPGLAWELGPGRTAKYSLTLSPEGRLDLRRLTERWVRSAPTTGPYWEYYPARQPSENLSLTIAGTNFDPLAWRYGIRLDEARQRVSVGAHHPAMQGLARNHQLQALFVSLDQLLGEDGVQKCLGDIDIAETAPPDPKTPNDLRTIVKRLSDATEREWFVIANGKDALGRPLFLMYDQRLKPQDHLLAELLIRVDLMLRRPTDLGLTDDTEAEDLNRIEHALTDAAPDLVSIGRMTGRGQRNIFFYTEEAEASTVGNALKPVLDANPDWKPQLSVQADPNWEFYESGLFKPFAG